MNEKEAKEQLAEFDRIGSQKFLKGLAWGVFLSVTFFWIPVLMALFGKSVFG